MSATCYTCHTAPAGHPDSPYSAYCASCQPVVTRPALPPRSSRCECAACGRLFLNDSAFDAHQVLKGGFRCVDPAGLGFTQNADGVWGTPEGHAAIAAATVRLADSRARAVRQTAVQPALVSSGGCGGSGALSAAPEPWAEDA